MAKKRVVKTKHSVPQFTLEDTVSHRLIPGEGKRKFILKDGDNIIKASVKIRPEEKIGSQDLIIAKNGIIYLTIPVKKNKIARLKSPVKINYNGNDYYLSVLTGLPLFSLRRRVSLSLYKQEND